MNDDVPFCERSAIPSQCTSSRTYKASNLPSKAFSNVDRRIVGIALKSCIICMSRTRATQPSYVRYTERTEESDSKKFTSLSIANSLVEGWTDLE